jgi:hypothetical protein
MMKRWILLCAALVLVQVGLTLWTHLGEQRSSRDTASEKVLDLQGARITGLLLEDGEGRSLELARDKERWILPGSGGFPADAARVQGLIDKLVGLQRGWPEATTAEAAARFKVATERFAHKLTLPETVVFFGTSPGLRKLYFRADQDPEIHALAIAPHDLDTRADAWIDTAVLHLQPEQVARVRLPGVELVRTKEGLQPVGMREDEELIMEARDSLVNRLIHLSITSILGREERPEYGLNHPVLEYSLEFEDGSRRDYRFGKPSSPPQAEGSPAPDREESYVLKVSGQEQLLRVDGWQVEELKKVARSTLVREKAAVKDGTQSSGPVPADNTASADPTDPAPAVAPVLPVGQ